MKKYLMLLSVAGSLGFSSCLKDKNVTDKLYGTDGLEDIKTVEITESPDRVLSYDVSSELRTVSIFKVNLNVANVPSADTKVTLAFDEELLAAYNVENETEYELFPTDKYSFSGLEVTVPKGSRSANVTISFKSEDLLDGPYALPLKLVSTSDPSLVLSENYQNIVVIVGAKNKYDGLYKLKIRTTGWAAFGIADDPTVLTYPEEYAFITASANSNKGSATYRGDLLVPALTSAGGPTAFGAAAPLFTFDPTTNLLTSVTNLIPDDGRGRTFAINPAVTDSRFDPATKSIYLSFYLTQTGRPNLYFYDTLTYVGPR